MNTPALSLLRALDALDIYRVSFRILSHGKSLRHTSPVALTAESTPAAAPSLFSISDLFAAYSLTPRKGEYLLNVEDGRLTYLPETAPKAVKPVASRATAVKFSRVKVKASRRHTRHSDRLAA